MSYFLCLILKWTWVPSYSHARRNVSTHNHIISTRTEWNCKTIFLYLLSVFFLFISSLSSLLLARLTHSLPRRLAQATAKVWRLCLACLCISEPLHTVSRILHMQRILQESLFYVIIVISQLLAHPLLATPPLASVRVFLQMFCFHFPLFLLIVEFLRSFSLFLFFHFSQCSPKASPISL